MVHLPSADDVRIPDDPTGSNCGSDRDVALLKDLAAQILGERDHMVGFPVNLDFDYRPLADFLQVHGNNVGGPGTDSEYHLHSKVFERAVVSFFARLAGDDDAFGYVTSGGTEGNLYGCYLGRERFPEAVLYASETTHYSMPKIARLLGMDYVAVETGPDRAMDLAALRRHHSSRKGRPAVVVATIGTTTGGAEDDLAGIRGALADAGTDQVHLHSDAAFGGLIAALAPEPRPWAFESGADSVAISGHKMLGAPFPCGIALARPEHVDAIRREGIAVGSDDDTITGSRDAFTPLLLWYELRRLGRTGLQRRVAHCLATAEYAEQRLREEGLHPQRAPGSNTVLFETPAADICARWNLLTVGDQAHLIAMPHVTGEHIDRLCADLRT
ncbi:histidine decarboxylase [Streptomyces spiroverticillatus]|uniref:Histidine decarboxylase n=1 Tax=Streptomyces finlayi TaxID=67296 RepID=A0A918X9D7_9ACTN|nr:histidine decarboxylase [Streptomyces finlayi]GHA48996.1 histidine decarboxylase [Streptomyces spiroverticillatus]GHD19238.1 histidine decarboxylase [Streptomyces finlayi]